MKQQWFKNAGFLYLPVHPMGYIISFLAILFMEHVVIAINSNAHSVTDQLYEIFVYATCTAFWWKWIAEKSNK